MLDDWKYQTTKINKKNDMNEEFRRLLDDIIAHAASGSSFAEGKEAFKAQIELQQFCQCRDFHYWKPVFAFNL